MRRWIGVWPPVSPAVYSRPRQRPLPYPLSEPGCRLYKRARHALWQGVHSLGLGTGDEVLVPGLHHGSEVEALVRAGLVPRHYDVDDRLEPDADALEALLGPRVRALYVIHYLGFPREVARWRSWCDERGLLLLEDAAQAWLSKAGDRPVGSFGALAIFCLYKMAGLSTGGALICRDAPPPPSARPRLGLGELLASHRAWLAQRGVGAGGPRDPEPTGGSLEEFEFDDPDSAPSSTATFLFARTPARRVVDRRRSNYLRLLEELEDLVPAPFDRLPDGACPLQLPIRAPDKRRLTSELAARGVEAARWWPLPHPSTPSDNLPMSGFWRNEVVGLPVHHGLGRAHVEHLAKAARAASAACG